MFYIIILNFHLCSRRVDAAHEIQVRNDLLDDGVDPSDQTNIQASYVTVEPV